MEIKIYANKVEATSNGLDNIVLDIEVDKSEFIDTVKTAIAVNDVKLKDFEGLRKK